MLEKKRQSDRARPPKNPSNHIPAHPQSFEMSSPEAAELRQYIRMIRKWWWLVAVGTLVAGGLGFWVSTVLPPVYRASTILLIKVDNSRNNDYDNVRVSELLAATYTELLTTRPVIETVAQTLGQDPKGLEKKIIEKKEIEARLIPDTSLIELTVEDTDPRLAMELANGIVTAFQKTGWESRAISIRDLIVAEPATQPLKPVAPRKLVNTLLAAIVGFTLSIGIVFLIEYLDDDLKAGENIYRS